MPNKSIVFLYTELAGYIRACMEALAKTGVDVSVFAYPVNAEAPFEFDAENSLVHYYDRNSHETAQLNSKILELKPDVVVCSGWIDDGYLKVLSKNKGLFKSVVALDNQMPATVKEKLALLRAKIKFGNLFDYAWVPGPPQVAYAKALGFSANRIFEGFYTADYQMLSRENWDSTEYFPKRFVYVGRYVDFKGVKDLWKAFNALDKNGWQLFCAGHGELYAGRDNSPGINHMGFVQPAELNKFVAQGGVFVLPSRKEPWGVVVHEFASAGYPLLCSNRVGSAAALLENNINGLSFKAGSVKSLMQVMERMVHKPDKELWEMGAKSKKIASVYTIEKWVKTALHILN
ncbi:MAG: glycosyltransferase family 4 protein [Cryomorphaceae bacterium]